MAGWAGPTQQVKGARAIMSDETRFVPGVKEESATARVRRALEAQWSRGELPDVWTVIGSEPLPLCDLVAILSRHQIEQWRCHQPVLIEAYFERRPDLLGDEPSALALIRSELELRSKYGQSPTLAEYARRFPQWARKLSDTASTQPGENTLLPGTSATSRGDETLLPGSSPAISSQAVVSQAMQETILPGSGSGQHHETIFHPSGSENTHRHTGAGPLPPPRSDAPLPAPVGPPEIPGYEILSELGRGGMGVVYKARQVRAERNVALKVIRPDMLSLMEHDTQSSTIGRFRHEAKAAGRLQHDNIVTVYEVGEWNSYHYYAMRMVDGPSLIQLLRERPLENQTAARFLAGTARGVQYAHDLGILHRDLKPHNVLIDSRTQRPLVADFGLAKFTADDDSLTRAGDVIGTPSYMSPEQARDSSRVTTLSDVYSLGATLYHVLAGRPPFQAANLGETLRQILHDEPLPPRQLNPAIDADLETICLKCLQKEPARRYASCAELADELERYLRHEPIHARPVGNTEKVVRWCRRNPALAGSIGAVVVLTLVAVIAIVSGYIYTARALADEAVQRARAEESLKEALEAIDNLQTRVSDNVLLSQPGLQGLRRELLLSAKSHYQKLLDRKWNNPRIRMELANAVFRVGDIERLFRNMVTAEEHYRIAEESQRQLLAEMPDDPKLRLALSNTVNAQGQILYDAEKWELARDRWQEALRLRDEIATHFRDDVEFLRRQANIHMNLGMAHMKLLEGSLALREQQQAQEMRSEQLKRFPDNEKLRNDQAKGSFNLGRLYFALAGASESPEENQANIENGKRALEAAIEQFSGLLRNARKHPVYRQQLVTCSWILADNTGDFATAEPLYRRALEEIHSLVADNPEVDEYRINAASYSEFFIDRLARNMRADEIPRWHERIEEDLQSIAPTTEMAARFAMNNQFNWAALVDTSTPAGRDHLQKAREYALHFQSLTSEKELAADLISQIDAKLAPPPPSGEQQSSPPEKSAP